MKKQTKILIEIERVRVSYQINKRNEAFCRRCGSQTEFLSQAEASALIGNQSSTDFHTELAPDNNLIFCLKSILERISH